MKLFSQNAKFLSGGSSRANSVDGILIELGTVMGFAAFPAINPSAVRHRVVIISASCIPAQIRKGIVGAVSIAMAAIMFFWSWANKCLKDQHVNENPPARLAYRDGHVAFPIIKNGKIPSLYSLRAAWVSLRRYYSIQATDIAMIGNLIARMTGNVFPDFHCDLQTVRKSNYTLRVTH